MIILSTCSCKNSTKEGDMQLYVTGDNRCGWNMVAVMNTTGLKMRDIIYAQFQPEVRTYGAHACNSRITHNLYIYTPLLWQPRQIISHN